MTTITCKPSISEYTENFTEFSFLKHPELKIFTLNSVDFYGSNTASIACYNIRIPAKYIEYSETSNLNNITSLYLNFEHTISQEKIQVDITNWRINSNNNLEFLMSHSSKEIYVEANKLSYIKEDTIWYDKHTVKLNFHEIYIKESIRTRYAFLNRPLSGFLNPVIDTFFPQLYYTYGKDVNQLKNHKLPYTSVAISPVVANALNIKQITTEQMCLVLGYTKKKIRQLVSDVKHQQYSFVFVGAGGTNVNTSHWLSELCKLTNVYNLFNSIRVFENDDAEVSNLLRFPVDTRTFLSDTSSKLNIMKHTCSNLSKYFYTENTYIPTCYHNGDVKYPDSLYYNDYTSKVFNKIRNSKTILYGAPSIETRDSLSKHGHFLCATHSDSDCSIWLNPIQESLNIQVESYGMIQLGAFFMNQLKLTLTTLELLASGTLDLMEKDKELLNYSFTGESLGKTDRTYNWQIAKDVVMLTEENSQLGEIDV